MKKTLFLLLFVNFSALIFSQNNYVSNLEKEIMKLINQERIEHNLTPLKSDEKLYKIAKSHSQDMVKRNFTSHVTPDGLGPNDRAKKAGFNIKKQEKNGYRIGIGENIYETQAMMEENGNVKYYLEKTSIVAKKAVDSWMASPGHRKNILSPDYKITGIGVAVSNDKKIKITQVFF
ncbi:MAG TPA: CAP domain-containing protein [Candidatus Goldiibacteriota bacterium]|nr:CAP domain-containing protein [Candidatus Goldiibacteriota bacterium]